MFLLHLKNNPNPKNDESLIINKMVDGGECYLLIN